MDVPSHAGLFKVYCKYLKYYMSREDQTLLLDEMALYIDLYTHNYVAH